MTERRTPARGFLSTLSAALLLSIAGPASAEQTYDYNAGGERISDSGFVLVIEGILTNPRNADNVIATEISGVIQEVIPAWDDELAGRLGLGYQWSNGNRIMGTFWGYDTSARATGTGNFAFSIGPPVGAGEGDYGTEFDIETELTAWTADLAFGRLHHLSEPFEMEWSVGFRHANFEETASGRYTSGSSEYAPRKSNEAEMFGARVAGRATYHWGRFAVTAAVGASFLDGQLTAFSGMTEVGVPDPASSASTLQDDGRSGQILDFDVAAVWNVKRDSVDLWLGWEQQVWNGVPADLMRNLPGTAVTLRDRDSITFSGFKLGLRAIF